MTTATVVTAPGIPPGVAATDEALTLIPATPGLIATTVPVNLTGLHARNLWTPLARSTQPA